jgi:hypothetical protein
VSLLVAVDPPDLAKGRYAAPAWLILTVGGLVLAVAVALLAVRLRSAKKGDR